MMPIEMVNIQIYSLFINIVSQIKGTPWNFIFKFRNMNYISMQFNVRTCKSCFFFYLTV